MKNEDIVITSGFRTAIGSYKGTLSNIPATELGAKVIEECIKHSKLKNDEVDMVYMGQVLTTGAGQNPARQAAIKAHISIEKGATTINQVCGSGLAAVAMAFNSLKCGDGKIIIAGGQENMSLAPEFLIDFKKKKSMIIDGLWDVYNKYHMGNTAENVATKYNISREDQDQFAISSQTKSLIAIDKRKFKEEIVPIKVKVKDKEVIFDKDEHPRNNLDLKKLSNLRTVFKENGTVTAGNSSGINDGAAALTLMLNKTALDKKLKPLAKIVSWAQCGVDPAYMGTGPIPASREALKKANWNINDLDLIECNEAFASQSISVFKDLGLDSKKVNVNGGAIALGHPIGASGARILVTLIHEMQKSKSKKGLATLCIGGGMGIAMCVEKIQ